jgi:hypothetical protein
MKNIFAFFGSFFSGIEKLISGFASGINKVIEKVPEEDKEKVKKLLIEAGKIYLEGQMRRLEKNIK